MSGSPFQSAIEAVLKPLEFAARDDFAYVADGYCGLQIVRAGGIPGDVNEDGHVGLADLLMLLAAWGDCPDPPADCPADVDDDGDVDFADLLVLLANWG